MLLVRVWSPSGPWEGGPGEALGFTGDHDLGTQCAEIQNEKSEFGTGKNPLPGEDLGRPWGSLGITI